MKNRIWLYLLIGAFILIFGCTEDRDVFYVHLNTSIIYDQDGNICNTILIGSQTWMAGNLSVTKFNDGTTIPLITDATSWNNLSTPACCWQSNFQAYKVTYGVLYNWYAVNTGKLCPVGWHVASEAEWNKLTDYLGGESIAGGKLKESGFKHWDIPNTDATNESGFRALPGGTLNSDPDGLFCDLHEKGCWWTTESNENWAANRIMNANSNSVQKQYCLKKWGLSVRCIKD